MANESTGAPQWVEPKSAAIATTALLLYWVASGVDWVLSETGPPGALMVEDPADSGEFVFYTVALAPVGRRQLVFLRTASGDVAISY